MTGGAGGIGTAMASLLVELGATVVIIDLGSGPINLCFWANGDSECQRSFTMSYLFWLSEAQMSKIEPFFPLAHGVPRVDNRKVISGIIFVLKNGGL